MYWIRLLLVCLPLVGCAAETVEFTSGDFRYAEGRVAFGIDKKSQRELPTPLGMAKSNSEERGAPESLQAVSDDVTTTASVFVGFITVTKMFTSLMDGIVGVNAASKAAGVEKAAIGAGAKEIPK